MNSFYREIIYLGYYYIFIQVSKIRNNEQFENEIWYVVFRVAWKEIPLPVYRRKQTGTLVPGSLPSCTNNRATQARLVIDTLNAPLQSLFSLERYVTIALHFDVLPRLLRVIINRLKFPRFIRHSTPLNKKKIIGNMRIKYSLKFEI